MIDETILAKYGGIVKTYSKDEFIFKEGEPASFYFQLKNGEVKMNNYAEEGREFIQSIFSKNRSFGEAPLFGDFPYPANAIATENSQIIKLSKPHFYTMLLENPQMHLKLTKAIAERLYYKALMAAGISSNDAEERILKLLDYLKNHVYQITEPFGFEVQLKRQEIADLTGLRVETVIRSMKKMESLGEIKIINRKVWR